MTMMLVQHNTFFNLSDHLTQIIRSEFKDSTAGEKYSSGRTKTAAIVNYEGDTCLESLKYTMQNHPCNLLPVVAM